MDSLSRNKATVTVVWLSNSTVASASNFSRNSNLRRVNNGLHMAFITRRESAQRFLAAQRTRFHPVTAAFTQKTFTNTDTRTLNSPRAALRRIMSDISECGTPTARPVVGDGDRQCALWGVRAAAGLFCWKCVSMGNKQCRRRRQRLYEELTVPRIHYRQHPWL